MDPPFRMHLLPDGSTDPISMEKTSRPSQLALPLNPHRPASDSTTTEMVLTPSGRVHLSRHFALSPAGPPPDMFLLSPTSASQQQQQQQVEMSFTSAFSSSNSLRHRRGKTLILPKLKIVKGQQEATVDELTTSSSTTSSFSSSFQHFRRSVSTSTFAETSAWYNRRQSSTNTVADFMMCHS